MRVDCSGNLLMPDPERAKELSESCPAVGGDVIIPSGVPDIDIDGIELIEGSLRHPREDEAGNNGTSGRSAGKIQSTTQAVIQGNLSTGRVSELQLPELAWINGSLTINSSDVTLANLTRLRYSGPVYWKTEELGVLDLPDYQGLAEPNSKGSLELLSLGRNVPEGSTFLKNAVNNPNATITIRGLGLPGSRNVTVGWAESESIAVSDCPRLILGRSDRFEAGSMHVKVRGGIELKKGVMALERGTNVMSLTAGKVGLQNTDMETLNLPFDSVE
ncbi:hypothetical protein ACHAQH_007731 [Verticillium albo-atrum]